MRNIIRWLSSSVLECCLAQCWNVGCSEVGLEVPDRVPLQTSLDQWHQLARVPGNEAVMGKVQ